MKTIANTGAQGDVLFVRVEEIPDDAKREPEAEEYVVAHSETGHHHVARRGKDRSLSVYSTADPLVGYLEFRGGPQPIEHLRSFDTHETLELLERASETVGKIDAVLDEQPARFKVIRQRQQTPEGMQRVVD